MAKYVQTGKISPQTSQALDVTRAIAAALVVLFHARLNTFCCAPFKSVYELLYAPANCGSPAVLWFFVISGYLVGGSVIAEVAQTGNFNFRRYLIGRMTRLYIVLLPALALGAFLDSARIAEWGVNEHSGYETEASLSAVTLVGNILYLQTIVVPTFGSNWPLWSLANEFWYYVTFPLLLAPLMINQSLFRRMMLFSLGAALMVFIAMYNISIPWLFTLWLMGAVVRFVAIRPIKFPALAWSIAVAVLLAFPYLHPRLGLLSTQLVAITFAIALLGTHWQVSKMNERWAVLANRLSGFSFSLYLVHSPLLHFITTGIGQSSDPFLGISPSSVIGFGYFIALVAVSYVVAFSFSQLTERHTDHVRRLLQIRVIGKLRI